MERTLGELAGFVGGEVTGDPQTVIANVASINDAKRGDITFIANRKYAHYLAECQASAVVLGADIGASPIPAIRVKNPDLAFARIVDAFAPAPPRLERAIHPTVVLGRDVELGRDIAIHAYSVVQDGARIGEGTTIYPQVYVGHHATIGRNCLVYPQVVIRERCIIGDNCIIHSGAVIGSDGFGFSSASGVHQKIPQIGIVEVGNDVEIGANVTIDRARFGKTSIGRGTKIDNLVQIAHNVQVGEDCLIIAQAGIAGSTKVGRNVILAGQAGIDGHRSIGDRVVIGAKSGVTRDIPANQVVSGYPAHNHERELRLQAIIRKLPELVERVKALEERLRETETPSKDDSQKH